MGLKGITWKKIFTWLISPAAIGIYLTFLTVCVATDYYINAAKGSAGRQGLSGVLYAVHQKSVDFRLNWRGERKVNPQVALLTVDDRAVNTIGRWPWPRATLAKAIENAFKYNAKLLAFDMVFSEPSINPVDVVYQSIQQSGQLTSELDLTLKTYTERLDNDKTLGETFKKHADKIVAGSFFLDKLDSTAWNPEFDFCLDLVFKQTEVAKQWDKEEVLLSVKDQRQPYMPSSLTDAFTGALQEKDQLLRQEYGTPTSRTEEVANKTKAYNGMREFCGEIFKIFREPLTASWPEILKNENPKEFNFPSFDAWLENYTASSFHSSVPYVEGWSLNTPTVAEGTKHTAYFNTEPDKDGTIRSKSMIVRTGNSYFPALALKAFLVANDYNASPELELRAESGKKDIVKFEITNNETGDPVMTIPVDSEGRLMINYAGPDRKYPYLSFADLLSDSPDAEIELGAFDKETNRWKVSTHKVKKAEFIKDKIFVVGATATGIFDMRVTPFAENYPGAETHANVIDNLLTRRFLRALPGEPIKMIGALALMGVLLSAALAYLGAVSALGLTAAVGAGIYFYDKYYLFGHGTVVAIFWPFALLTLLYIALTFYRYLTEERGKKELRQTFSKYVSPAIVDEILSHPQNIELGGKKTNLTVMFSDVRGFTTISEKLDPRALSDLLNSYLTPMTEIVFKNQGTLDKYMGDAIMAFFGAPIQYNDHAKYACRCALQSVTKLFELQKEWERKGLPNIDLGIGLNTGDVSVGNMGSETVRSYTVMGDAVNLASRLEGINKQYGTRIILSEMTYKEVKDNFTCREVDWVRVKGKVLPVKIFELISEEKPPATMVEVLKWFQQGYEHYHAKAWQQGLDCFAKALDLRPEDEVSKLYVERCRDYINEPPEEGWDGVFIMKTK